MSEVKTSRVLTRETVLRGNPCEEYRERFIERFPESVEVTVELAVSQATDWDWCWAANELLTSTGKAEWFKRIGVAEQEHDTVMRPYQDALDEASNQRWAAYDKALEDGYRAGVDYTQRQRTASKVSQRIVEIPRAAERAAREIASKRLNEARAAAWAEVFISETDEALAASRAPVEFGACDCPGCRADRENNDW